MVLYWRNKGLSDLQIASINAYVKDPKKREIKQVHEDEGVRFPSNRGSTSELKTVFTKNGVVTAGNASQIITIDGAGAVVLASAEAVKKYNLRVRARILSHVCVDDPLLMSDGVIPATCNALKKANLNSNDIDLFEVNETFAVVVCAWHPISGFNWDKVNINGCACAHGHTAGATRAILMTKLANDLEYNEKKYGLQTMCIGGDMTAGTVIERCNKVLPPRSNLCSRLKL